MSKSTKIRHPYTENLNSETLGDSKIAFLHCGDNLVLCQPPQCTVSSLSCSSYTHDVQHAHGTGQEVQIQCEQFRICMICTQLVHGFLCLPPLFVFLLHNHALHQTFGNGSISVMHDCMRDNSTHHVEQRQQQQKCCLDLP